MTDSSEMWEEAARKVNDAETDNFADLVRLSGLDIKRHLRFQRFSGLSFRDCDLRGFDFTGARLIGCDFTGARIEGARFDQAEIDTAQASYAEDGPKAGGIPVPGGDLARRNPLRAAADWNAYVAGWRRPERLARDGHLPVGAVFQDAPFAPEMVIVPPGRFMMGAPEDEPKHSFYEGRPILTTTWDSLVIEGESIASEWPRREVTIAQAFAIGRYAVTFDEWDFAQGDKEWRKITGRKARKPNDQDWGRGNLPVINVTWRDARAYAKWLSAKTGRAYRLPSEAEWEYSCRAGTVTPFWWGSAIKPSQANYDGNGVYEGGGEKGEYRERTVPVDAFGPNPWGLYQMHGNVWEWVEDTWHETYKGAPDDGSVWAGGDESLRVLRGGSWDDDPQSLRTAGRSFGGPNRKKISLGFRVSRTLNP